MSKGKGLDWSAVDWTQSQRTIAKQQGCSQAAVSWWMRSRGINPSGRSDAYRRTDQWFIENPWGWLLLSDKMIAKEVGVCWTVVRRVRRTRRLVRRFVCRSKQADSGQDEQAVGDDGRAARSFSIHGIAVHVRPHFAAR